MNFLIYKISTNMLNTGGWVSVIDLVSPLKLLALYQILKPINIIIIIIW